VITMTVLPPCFYIWHIRDNHNFYSSFAYCG
jgi:hypothetical protein